MELKYIISIELILVFIFAGPLNAVTVNPALCPTNKIAPHRRIASWGNKSQSRTFGAYYNLLVPGGLSQPNVPLNSLQEEPQKDDPDDCGDIADYDENDLSSLTTQSQRRYGYGNSRLFFGFFNNGGQGSPDRPTTNRPVRPQKPGNPIPPTKPPYWSGGFFGNNPYRPPVHQYPSDNIKPVYEGAQEQQPTYRPNVVGGPLGHVVGVSPVIPQRRPVTEPGHQIFSNDHVGGIKPGRPPRPPVRESTQRIPNHVQFSNRPTEAPAAYPTRRPRPRKLNDSNVFGSFFDLLFK